MSDQIILKSVGSYVDTNGHVGPLGADGLPDMYEGTSVDVIDVDDEWVERLSEEDCASFLSVVLHVCGQRERRYETRIERMQRPYKAVDENYVSTAERRQQVFDAEQKLIDEGGEE